MITEKEKTSPDGVAGVNTFEEFFKNRKKPTILTYKELKPSVEATNKRKPITGVIKNYDYGKFLVTNRNSILSLHDNMPVSTKLNSKEVGFYGKDERWECSNDKCSNPVFVSERLIDIEHNQWVLRWRTKCRPCKQDAEVKTHTLIEYIITNKQDKFKSEIVSKKLGDIPKWLRLNNDINIDDVVDYIFENKQSTSIKKLLRERKIELIVDPLRIREKNYKLLAKMQHGKYNKPLYDVVYPEAYPDVLNVKWVNPVTNKTVKRALIDLHHINYVNGKSQNKSSVEPSNICRNQEIWNSEKLLIEFLGIMVVTPSSHKLIHLTNSEMTIDNWPKDKWNWAIRNKENFNEFKVWLNEKFSVNYENLTYERVLNTLRNGKN